MKLSMNPQLLSQKRRACCLFEGLAKVTKLKFILLGFSLKIMVKYTVPIVFALLDLLAPATILQGCFTPWKSLSDLDYEKNQSFEKLWKDKLGDNLLLDVHPGTEQ